MGVIIESDARFTGVQLKGAAKSSSVIGLITKHADSCMIQYSQHDVNILRVCVQTKKKDYVPHIIYVNSSQNPRYFHTSCARSEPFHAG